MCSVRSGIIVCAILIFISSTAYGGDDLRKGYFSGLGLGVAPISGWRVDAERNHFSPAIALNVFIGYAWNSKNAITVENNRSFKITHSINPDDDTTYFVQMGIWGINWYHYFGEEGKSIYTSIGIGQYFAFIEDNDLSGHLGFMTGCGYEFKKHWQVGVYATGAKARSAGYGRPMTSYYQISIEFMRVNY